MFYLWDKREEEEEAAAGRANNQLCFIGRREKKLIWLLHVPSQLPAGSLTDWLSDMAVY